MAYSARGHVASECTGRFLPDAGIQFFRSGKNPSADPADRFDNEKEYQHRNGVHGVDVIDYKGTPDISGST